MGLCKGWCSAALLLAGHDVPSLPADANLAATLPRSIASSLPACFYLPDFGATTVRDAF